MGKDGILCGMAEKFRLYYTAKPYVLNQGWGIRNPVYDQFGFTRHNGIDIALGRDKSLYAPFNGTIVRLGFQPNGGGNFFGLMSDTVYSFPDGEFRVLMDFLHCESIAVKEGDKMKTGDFMAIADNTGLTTGPHTHLQPRRVKYWNGLSGDNLAWTPEDVNDANGSFNPVPYFTGVYAVDYNTLVGYYQQLLFILQRQVESRSVTN